MYVKYEVSISYDSKVMTKATGFFPSQMHRHTDRQTGQKLETPEFQSRGMQIT